MDIQLQGANCITLTTKQARLVIDDNLEDLGLKAVAKSGDIILYTMAHPRAEQEARLVIDRPGEYEVAEASIYGIAARAHLDEEGKRTATMYKIIIDDLRVLVTGHVYPDLTDAQLEIIGMVDVMFVPVGGNGYTLDGIGALKLIKKVEPKVIIPTHFEHKDLHFPVPQHSLEMALKNLGMEPKERAAKLKLKQADLEDATQLIVLEH